MTNLVRLAALTVATGVIVTAAADTAELTGRIMATAQARRSSHRILLSEPAAPSSRDNPWGRGQDDGFTASV
jgi:hypothetical protein